MRTAALRSLAVVAALLVTDLARAEAPPAFARLRDQAQPLDSLNGFVDRYVGSCTMIAKQECEANVRRARAEMTGKSYYLTLDDAASRNIKGAGFNPATREYDVDLTPFFDGGGIALTQGEPSSRDAGGHPRIGLIRMRIKLPDDWMPMDVERLLRIGGIKVHLVFKPMGVWSMPAKPGWDKYEGVKARFLALRLTEARTGDDLALKVFE